MADTSTDTTTARKKPKASKRAPAVTARERAKAVMAAKRAAQLEREKKIEDALTAVLDAAEAETAAAAKRDLAITVANAAYGQAVADADKRCGTALRLMRDLDEPLTSLVEMTGLSRARITELIKHTDPAPTENAACDGDAATSASSS